MPYLLDKYTVHAVWRHGAEGYKVVPGGVSGEGKQGGDSAEGWHNPTPQNSLHHLQCPSPHLSIMSASRKQSPFLMQQLVLTLSPHT